MTEKRKIIRDDMEKALRQWVRNHVGRIKKPQLSEKCSILKATYF